MASDLMSQHGFGYAMRVVSELGPGDRDAYARGEELKAMRFAADAVIRFAERHAERAAELAAAEADPTRKAELERISEVCTRVPAYAPRDFWEALQATWLVHLVVTTELNTWDAFFDLSQAPRDEIIARTEHAAF